MEKISLGAATTIRKKFAGDAHLALAEFCFPEGSEIECRKCNIKRNCTISEIADWLKNGYLVCKKCEQKTELVNPHIVRRMDFE